MIGRRVRASRGPPTAVVRDAKEAVQLASRLCKETDWHEPVNLLILAVAYAEGDNFQEGSRLARVAIKLLGPNDKRKKAFESILQQLEEGNKLRGRSRPIAADSGYMDWFSTLVARPNVLRFK